MEWDEAVELTAKHGDSFYVLDLDVLGATVARWLAEFRSLYPDTQIAYPYKANNLLQVCRAMADLDLWAEVCSPAEVALAHSVGLPPGRVLYNGSGRPADSLVAAAQHGVAVVVDSPRDARIIAAAVAELDGKDVAVGLRCDVTTPPSRLGMRPDGSEWRECLSILRSARGVRINGLHSHVPGATPTQFATRTRALVTIADTLFSDGGLHYIDVGGGFYGHVPHVWPGPGPAPTPGDYAAAVATHLPSATTGSAPTLIIEPGTALVATAMSFVTRVMDVKAGPRGPVAVVAGSIFHTSPNTRRTDFPLRILTGSPGRGLLDVAGSSPMPDEWMALDVEGTATEGDFAVFHNVGAYSVSMQTTFTHPTPAVLARRGDRYEVIAGVGRFGAPPAL